MQQQPQHAYEFLYDIGRGTFSTVGLCVHKQSKKEVAIKRMQFGNETDRAASTELDIFRRVENHPFIIQFYEYFITKNCHHFVLEKAEMTLTQCIAALPRPLSIHLCSKIVCQVATALSKIHELGYIHTDVKPDNIVIVFYDPTKNIVVKLIDFGCARIENDIRSIFATRIPYVTSRYYRAPEVVFGSTQHLSRSLDTWSLACVAYEIATNEILFPGNNNVDMICWFDITLGCAPNDYIEQRNNRILYDCFHKPQSRTYHETEQASRRLTTLLRQLQPSPSRVTLNAKIYRLYMFSMVPTHLLMDHAEDWKRTDAQETVYFSIIKRMLTYLPQDRFGTKEIIEALPTCL